MSVATTSPQFDNTKQVDHLPELYSPARTADRLPGTGAVDEPHGTPKNHSPLRRRALQFHYCAADAEKITVKSG